MAHPVSKIWLLFCALLMGATPAYAQLDTTGLIAHWPFNGNLNDVTGKGHNALATNTSTWAAHAPTYAAGINKAVTTACVFDTTYIMNGIFKPDLNKIKQFSICAVLKFSSASSWSTILARNANFISAYGEPTWGAEISRADTGTNVCLTPVSYINIPYDLNERQPYQYYPSTVSDKWYYMVVTYNGSVFKTYVNGILKKEYYKSNAQYDTVINGNLCIGHRFNFFLYQADLQFEGLMDDLRLYNRALSDSEILRYPFNLLDTTVVLNMPKDSVICAGVLLNARHIVSKQFRSTNVFTVQMSDTNGSFAVPIQIGRDSTNLSGSIPCIIPSTIPSGRYKIRLIATAPADTTLEFDVNYHPLKNMTATTKAIRHGIVSRYPPPNGMCAGDSMVFTIGSYAGMGEGPAAYRWQKNASDIPGENGPVYSTKGIDNQDSFRCILKSNHACWFGDSVASSYYTVRVDSVLVPVVSIAVTPDDSVCLGETPIFYITHKMNAGNLSYSPTWFVKNKTTTVYNYKYADSLQIGNIKHLDTVYAAVTSNLTCALKGEIPSNYIVIHVDSNLFPPKATISVQPGAIVPAGTDVTFTAHVSDTGDSPIFQWLKNNQPIPGATGKTFFAPYPSLAFSDEIRFFVRNTTDKCAKPDTAISNGITVTYAYIDVPVIGNNSSLYSIYPNPNTGSFILEGAVAGTEQILATLTDITGRILYNKEISPENAPIHAAITLDNNSPSGIYLLRLSSTSETQILRVTVRK